MGVAVIFGGGYDACHNRAMPVIIPQGPPGASHIAGLRMDTSRKLMTARIDSRIDYADNDTLPGRASAIGRDSIVQTGTV